MYTKFWSENPIGRAHLQNLGVNEWKILKLIIKKLDITVWTGFIWLRIGFSGGLCEH
jgi:hypothetical protein